MRIAVVNWSRRRVGGVESYLSTVIPELARDGHTLAFWHEVDEPLERAAIALPADAPSWCAAELGRERALAALGEWQPEVIYAHKLLDPELERMIQKIAPAVFFAHDYNGTCISGDKTFKRPSVRPCDRRFGWQCLLHYYPHRCGGLSPRTMFRLYSLQAERLKNLHRYDAIVTHSDHMLSELIKHGLSPQRAYNFPYYVQHSSAEKEKTREGPKPSWHLLFSGRMERLKGGEVFMDALPRVLAGLNKPLSVTFAGDGRERRAWEARAARLRGPGLEIKFAGWIDREKMDQLLNASDLLVVPSLWPEPFGLVGPEAGLSGIPVAAFSVGGIPDWLLDGVNGYLAPGDPPTAEGLAQAIIKCLSDAAHHEQLRRGAVRVARQFNVENHLTALLEVFHKVVSQKAARPELARS